MRKRTERLLLVYTANQYGSTLNGVGGGGVPERQVEMITLVLNKVKKDNHLGVSVLLLPFMLEEVNAAEMLGVQTSLVRRSTNVKKIPFIIKTKLAQLAIFDAAGVINCHHCEGRKEVLVVEDGEGKFTECPTCSGSGKEKIDRDTVIDFIEQTLEVSKKPVVVPERMKFKDLGAVYVPYCDMTDIAKNSAYEALTEIERLINEYDNEVMS